MSTVPPVSFVFEFDKITAPYHSTVGQQYIINCKNKDELRRFLRNCYVRVNNAVNTFGEFLSKVSVTGIRDVEIQAKIIFIKPPNHLGPYDLTILTDVNFSFFFLEFIPL